MLTKETYERITRRNGESLKALWQECMNRFVEAIESGNTQRAVELRARLDEVFSNNVDDNTTLMVDTFQEKG